MEKTVTIKRFIQLTDSKVILDTKSPAFVKDGWSVKNNRLYKFDDVNTFSDVDRTNRINCSYDNMLLFLRKGDMLEYYRANGNIEKVTFRGKAQAIYDDPHYLRHTVRDSVTGHYHGLIPEFTNKLVIYMHYPKEKMFKGYDVYVDKAGE